MKIILAEGRSDVRSALRLFLDQEFRNADISEISKTKDLMEQFLVTCPDLLLLDWELPEMKAKKVLEMIRDLCPALYIIATSGRTEMRQQALEAGVDAFINKSDTPEQMKEILKDVEK